MSSAPPRRCTHLSAYGGKPISPCLWTTKSLARGPSVADGRVRQRRGSATVAPMHEAKATCNRTVSPERVCLQCPQEHVYTIRRPTQQRRCRISSTAISPTTHVLSLSLSLSFSLLLNIHVFPLEPPRYCLGGVRLQNGSTTLCFPCNHRDQKVTADYPRNGSGRSCVAPFLTSLPRQFCVRRRCLSPMNKCYPCCCLFVPAFTYTCFTFTAA